TEALVPTIVSRAQLVRFALVPAAEIAQALTARAGVPPARARYLAALAGGRAGAALAAAAAGEEPFERRAEVLQTLRAVERGDVIVAIDAAEAVSRRKDDLERWLDTALWWFRDLVVWQTAGDPALLANLDCERDVAGWADRARGENLRGTVDAIEQAKAALRLNVNPRLVLEALFTRIGVRGAFHLAAASSRRRLCDPAAEAAVPPCASARRASARRRLRRCTFFRSGPARSNPGVSMKLGRSRSAGWTKIARKPARPIVP